MLNFNKYHKELILDIHTLGTGYNGEGQLIVLRNENNEKFVIIIDSLGDINSTRKILKDNKISKINYLIWTHPHEDHSNGIQDLLKEKSIKVEKVIVPPYLCNFIVGSSDTSENLYKEICSLEQSVHRINSERTSVDEWSGTRFILSEKLILDSSFATLTPEGNLKTDYNFQIISYTPNSEILGVRGRNKKIRNKNELSISIELVIGEFRAFFSSDIENFTIDRMEELTGIPNYLKIPHHGSDTSFNIADKIVGVLDESNTIDVGVIIGMKSNNLPTNNGVNFYSEYVKNLYYPEEEICASDVTHHCCSINIIKNVIEVTKEINFRVV